MFKILNEITGYFVSGGALMIVITLIYAPVYFFLRKKVYVLRQLAYLLLISCIFVILTATVLSTIVLTVIDGDSLFCNEHMINLIPFGWITDVWAMDDSKKFAQIAANMIMFIPFGFILPVTISKIRVFWRTTVAAFGFSLIIESVQYFIGRSCDVDDLIQNILGAVLGYAIFFGFASAFSKKKSWQKFIGQSVGKS